MDGWCDLAYTLKDCVKSNLIRSRNNVQFLTKRGELWPGKQRLRVCIRDTILGVINVVTWHKSADHYILSHQLLWKCCWQSIEGKGRCYTGVRLLTFLVFGTLQRYLSNLLRVCLFVFHIISLRRKFRRRAWWMMWPAFAASPIVTSSRMVKG